MIRLCNFNHVIEIFLLLLITIIPITISLDNIDQYDSIEYLANINNTYLNSNNSEYVNRNGYFIFNSELQFGKQDENIKDSSISNVSDAIINSQSSSFCNDTLFKCIGLSILLGLLIICTIIGNSFVIAAVILERNLHNLGNYLIVSLAFSDLTVAIMVMPIGAYQEVARHWSLGKIVCDIWTSFDVLSCTASILHLVAIALDRYMAITNLDYGAKRTIKRFAFTILIIWTVSAITAISPHIFGLSFDEKNQDRCHLTDNVTYQVFSTLAAFYLPLIIMCIIYWKIFQAAKFRIRKKGFAGGAGNNHSIERSKVFKSVSEKAKEKNTTNQSTKSNVSTSVAAKTDESSSIVKSKSNEFSKKDAGKDINESNNKNSIKLKYINNQKSDEKNSIVNSETEAIKRKMSRARRQDSRDQDSCYESDDSSIISIRNELIRNKERKEQMKQQQLELQQSEHASKIKKIIFKNKFLFKNLYSLQAKTSDNQINQNNDLKNSHTKLKTNSETGENEKKVNNNDNKQFMQKSISLKEDLSNTIKNQLNSKNSMPIKSFDNLVLEIKNNNNKINQLNNDKNTPNNITNATNLINKNDTNNQNNNSNNDNNNNIKNENNNDNENENNNNNNSNQLNHNNSEKKLRFKMLSNESINPDTPIESSSPPTLTPIVYNNFSPRPQRVVYLFDDTASFNKDVSSPLDPESSIIMFKDFSFSDRLSLNAKIPFVYPESDILSNSNISVDNQIIMNSKIPADSETIKQDIQVGNEDPNKIKQTNQELTPSNLSDNKNKNSNQSVSFNLNGPTDITKDVEIKPLNKSVSNSSCLSKKQPSPPNEVKASLTVSINNMNNSNTNLNNRQNSVKRPSDINSVLKRKAKIDIKRERKAAKTLGVIMSCFIMCWLPFFLMQILFSVCKECQITKILESSPLITILTWSGYLNSLLNPIIYTIFSPDFRSAFGKILFGRYNNTRRKRSFRK